MGSDSTGRFSNRVADYVRSRPRYPAAAIEVLRKECGLKPGCVVADLGSGTGILTLPLLECDATVYAVEPNGPMREAAESLLDGRSGFRSVDAPAENTTLGDASVDLVTAAQAFHWFDIPRTRRECARILRPGGKVAMLWNQRLTEADVFLEKYEALIKAHATDYGVVDHRKVGPAQFDAFFGKGKWSQAIVPNEQVLDFAGFESRLLSSSYVPARGAPGHEAMITALRKLFDAHQVAGQVTIRYETRVQWGRPEGIDI